MDSTSLTSTAELVETLPLDCLPQSALVDALLFAAGLKEMVRTKLLDRADIRKVSNWWQANRIAGTVDDDGFVFVSSSQHLIEQAVRIDNSTARHELAFGLLLGYPLCCCRAIAEAGEAEIDRVAVTASRWNFEGEFRLIDPSGYADGEALLCHLPCSPRCILSLRIARSARSFLIQHPPLLAFRNWQALMLKGRFADAL